jgi:hypothetical protein
MTNERYHFLMSIEGEKESLTPEEVKEGWHFCWEFDGLLRNNNEDTFKCTCERDGLV